MSLTFYKDFRIAVESKFSAMTLSATKVFTNTPFNPQGLADGAGFVRLVISHNGGEHAGSGDVPIFKYEGILFFEIHIQEKRGAELLDTLADQLRNEWTNKQFDCITTRADTLKKSDIRDGFALWVFSVPFFSYKN